MFLKSKHLFGCSILLFLIGINIGLLNPEESDPYLLPEAFPPLTWWDITACALVVLAAIQAMVATRIWFQERREIKACQSKLEAPNTVARVRNSSNVLFYILVVLAQIDFAFWLKVWHSVYTIQFYRVGDMDFAPQNSWDLSRPLIFSAVWTLLAIGSKSQGRTIELVLALFSLLAIASYVADYSDIYYFYLDFRQGIENPFIDYSRFGQWDVVRALVSPILTVWWMFDSQPSHNSMKELPMSTFDSHNAS